MKKSDMSCYHITMDGGHKVARPINSKQEYLRLRESDQQQRLLTMARNGDRKAKSRLVQFNYSLGGNTSQPLKGATTMGRSVGMDIDFDPKAKNYQALLNDAPQRILAAKDALGLLMMERSVSKGYHVVFRRQAHLSQEENLRWASQLLGIQFDAAAKDTTRVFFATSASSTDLLYLSDELFCNEPAEQSPSSVNNANKTANANPVTIETVATTDSVVAVQKTYPSTYGDVAYDAIVDALETQLGGRPEHGSRNAFIFSMACNLRYICNDDADWIAQILPTYGEARDKWLATIRSACDRKQTMAMSEVMRRAVKMAQQEQTADDGAEEQPPTMPSRLPRLIRLLTSKTPDIYRPAVAHAVFPALAAHLWRTRFTYIDNVEHEATLMCCLMAGTGAGKSCVSEPINRIMADIRERDRENLLREKQWKEESARKGANKDKRQRPENLVIQEIDADMTNPAFVMRTAEAQEHFLYTSLNELDQFDALRGQGNQQFRIMCLAFDPNNQYGQTRVGMQSVTERVTIRFNWNASTTIHKGLRYFRNVLTDGPVSRINFCTIPEREIGADMPLYGTYDKAFSEALQPYIDNLTKASGNIHSAEAIALAKRLKEENADYARMTQSRTFENLSFRANVIAYLKACVLYVANGCQWEPEIDEFIRWSEQYDLWCKMHFFAAAIEQAETEGDRTNRRGPRNLLQLLPDEFTLQEAEAIRVQNGMDRKGTKNMLNTWIARAYIKKECIKSSSFSNNFIYRKIIN